MKVVHLISTLQIGDAEVVLYELIKRLDTDKFSQSVIYFQSGSFEKTLKTLGVSLYKIEGLFFRYDPIFFVRLLILVRKLDPDCIHTMLFGANFWGRIVGKLLSIPSIHTLYEIPFHQGFVKNLLDRLLIRFFPKINIIAASDKIAQALEFHAPWIEKGAIKIIKNGFDRDRCLVVGGHKENVLLREFWGLTENNFVIGTVGKFETNKNYALLLTSFALLYDDYSYARLIIVGEGRQELFLKQRAFDLGIEDRVIFIVGHDATEYYNLFDCFVVAPFDGQVSVSLLEAMGRGLPCLATVLEAEHGIIRSGVSGLLVPPGDAFELSQSLIRFINDKELRAKVGAEAIRATDAYFSAQQMVETYAKAYQSLCQK